MVSKFEGAVLRLLYPSVDSAEEPHHADQSSQDNNSTELDDVICVNYAEDENLEPPALLAAEVGDEDGSTSPGKPSFTRAQRKRLKLKKQKSAKGIRFIGPRLPWQEDKAASTVHDTEERKDAPSIPLTDKQENAVVTSKSRRRRLAKKHKVENAGPASQLQGAAFVVERGLEGVVLKHIG